MYWVEGYLTTIDNHWFLLLLLGKPVWKTWSTLLKVICPWNHYDAKRILKKRLERNLHEKNNNDTIFQLYGNDLSVF